jgi:hypothetical protein
MGEDGRELLSQALTERLERPVGSVRALQHHEPGLGGRGVPGIDAVATHGRDRLRRSVAEVRDQQPRDALRKRRRLAGLLQLEQCIADRQRQLPERRPGFAAAP